jgi:hypothetical protein
MHEHQRRGPGPGLLLLIPIGLLIAKGIGRKRRMLASEVGAEGHRRFRHGFGPGAFDAEGRYSFALPPRLERVLGEWHDRVHAGAQSGPAGATSDTVTA